MPRSFRGPFFDSACPWCGDSRCRIKSLCPGLAEDERRDRDFRKLKEHERRVKAENAKKAGNENAR